MFRWLGSLVLVVLVVVPCSGQDLIRTETGETVYSLFVDGELRHQSSDRSVVDKLAWKTLIEDPTLIVKSRRDFRMTYTLDLPEPPPVDPPPPPAGDLGSVHHPPMFEPTIFEGETVTWSGEVNEGMVVVAGTLVIEDGTDAVFRGLQVLKGGSLIIGTEEDPVVDVNLAVEGELDLVNDPYQWFPGIVVGGHVEIHGALSGLNPRYAIPDTGEETDDPNGWTPETITLADGTQVSLGNELESRGLPKSINITRGCTFRGGHFALVGMATWNIEGLSCDGVGRTTNAKPNDTVELESGELHVGTNQRGRYALHWHHVHSMERGYCRNVLIKGGEKWGITIHGTDDVHLEDIVTWKVPGCGINIEGQDCDGIVLDRILAIRSTGYGSDGILHGGSHGGQRQTRQPTGKEINDGGHRGEGFWIEFGKGWEMRDSAALYNLNNGYFISAYWVKARGADALDTDDIVFENNLSWGNDTGLWITWDQGVSEWPYERRTYNLHSYNDIQAIVTYHTANLDFTGEAHNAKPYVDAGRYWSSIPRVRPAIGWGNPSYENGGHTISMNVTGFPIGMALPINTAAPADRTDEGERVRVGPQITGHYRNSINFVVRNSTGGPSEHFIDVTIGEFPALAPRYREGGGFLSKDLYYRVGKENVKHATTVHLNGSEFTIPALEEE